MIQWRMQNVVDVNGRRDAIMLGAVIAHRRKRRHLTQWDLAHAGNVTQATISRIEVGKAVPDVFVFQRLAHVLEVPPGELLAAVDDAIRRAKVFAKRNEVVINPTVARLVVEGGVSA